MTTTIMLCSTGFIYSAYDAGIPDAIWVKGSLRLKESTIKKFAESAAKNLGGKLERWWFDRNAGGYFADLTGVV
jgi:hypothetical protein